MAAPQTAPGTPVKMLQSNGEVPSSPKEMVESGDSGPGQPPPRSYVAVQPPRSPGQPHVLPSAPFSKPLADLQSPAPDTPTAKKAFDFAGPRLPVSGGPVQPAAPGAAPVPFGPRLSGLGGPRSAWSLLKQKLPPPTRFGPGFRFQGMNPGDMNGPRMMAPPMIKMPDGTMRPAPPGTFPGPLPPGAMMQRPKSPQYILRPEGMMRFPGPRPGQYIYRPGMPRPGTPGALNGELDGPPSVDHFLGDKVDTSKDPKEMGINPEDDAPKDTPSLIFGAGEGPGRVILPKPPEKKDEQETQEANKNDKKKAYRQDSRANLGGSRPESRNSTRPEDRVLKRTESRLENSPLTLENRPDSRAENSRPYSRSESRSTLRAETPLVEAAEPKEQVPHANGPDPLQEIVASPAKKKVPVKEDSEMKPKKPSGKQEDPKPAVEAKETKGGEERAGSRLVEETPAKGNEEARDSPDLATKKKEVLVNGSASEVLTKASTASPRRPRPVSEPKASKDGDQESQPNDKLSKKEPLTNGNHGSPKKSPSLSKLATTKKVESSGPKSPNKLSPKTPEAPSTADKKKVPMNKVQVGAAPSPNLKQVRSKIGSLQNTSHKPGGGKIKIENRKLDFSKAQPKIAAKNDAYTPGGGDKKITQQKLQWQAKSKIGSLENATHKPGGGDKKIEQAKIDFKEKAKPKVGSKDNLKHIPGGGNVKIEDRKLELKAESKIGSLENVKHKPGGGEKKIFDDKEYLRQMSGGQGSVSGQSETSTATQRMSRQSSNASRSSRTTSRERGTLKSPGEEAPATSPVPRASPKLPPTSPRPGPQKAPDQNLNHLGRPQEVLQAEEPAKREELVGRSHEVVKEAKSPPLVAKPPSGKGDFRPQEKDAVSNTLTQPQVKPSEVKSTSKSESEERQEASIKSSLNSGSDTQPAVERRADILNSENSEGKKKEESKIEVAVRKEVESESKGGAGKAAEGGTPRASQETVGPGKPQETPVVGSGKPLETTVVGTGKPPETPVMGFGKPQETPVVGSGKSQEMGLGKSLETPGELGKSQDTPLAGLGKPQEAAVLKEPELRGVGSSGKPGDPLPSREDKDDVVVRNQTRPGAPPLGVGGQPLAAGALAPGVRQPISRAPSPRSPNGTPFPPPTFRPPVPRVPFESPPRTPFPTDPRLQGSAQSPSPKPSAG